MLGPLSLPPTCSSFWDRCCFWLGACGGPWILAPLVPGPNPLDDADAADGVATAPGPDVAEHMVPGSRSEARHQGDRPLTATGLLVTRSSGGSGSPAAGARQAPCMRLKRAEERDSAGCMGAAAVPGIIS